MPKDYNKNPITKYWLEHYADENGECTLCGGKAVIDTTGVKNIDGVSVGKVNYCICPNGQVARDRFGKKK